MENWLKLFQKLFQKITNFSS